MLARPEWTAAPPALVVLDRPRGFRGAAALLRLWGRRIAQRNALATLGERDLRDIGTTRIDAMREAAKPFWRG
jgi:uncharacterized protein YjiS (DUF1127 family)